MGGGPAFSAPAKEAVDLLILGKGWTAGYLVAELEALSAAPPAADGDRSTQGKKQKGPALTWAATTRDGRDGTIPFSFQPEDGNDDKKKKDDDDDDPLAQYRLLPPAKCILVTFPLRGDAQPATLIRRYEDTHPPPPPPRREEDGASRKGEERWILLGATTTWSAPVLTTPDSPWDASNARARAEAAFLAFLAPSSSSSPSSSSMGSATAPASTSAGSSSSSSRGTVLCLSGLWDETARSPSRLIARTGRFAPDKEAVRSKKGVHWVHGRDVARALVRVVGMAVRRQLWPSDVGGGPAATAAEDEKDKGWEHVAGRRWILSDTRCYDWWDLLSGWDAVARGERQQQDEKRPKLEYARWVGEVMLEEGVATLPREPGALGRVLDARGFWAAIGVWPTAGRVT